MVCEIMKPGTECVFMKKKGCTYNGGHCHPIVEQCEGCERVMEFPNGNFCLSFTEPQLKWNRGTCQLATHVQRDYQVAGNKLNPLKASKRSMSNRG
jgi:hypothetical protein